MSWVKVLIFVFLFLVILVSLSFWVGFWWTLTLFVAIAGSLLIQGLQRVKSNPPHVGLVTFLGKRTEFVKKEGLGFFPLYPFLFGVIPIKVTKVNQDITARGRTPFPELAEIEVPISLTWSPDKESGVALVNFLDSDGEDGVKAILENTVKERIREWLISKGEGPMTWQDAIAADKEAVAVLAEAIFGEGLWEQEAQALNELRRGKGKIRHMELGIVIRRLNIGEIAPLGELAQAAGLRAKEEQERRGEITEIETDVLKAQRLVESFEAQGQRVSLQEAFQIIMEWKATREGHGFTVPGISPGLIEIARAILTR